MKASTVSLGPWIKGIQNVLDPVRTPEGCLSEAENVLIGPDGVVTPRAGFDLVTTGGHSLFRHQDRVYGVYNGAIVEFLEATARPLYAGITGKVNWGLLNDEPVFTNNSVLGRVTPTGVKLIGVEEPGGFAVPAHTPSGYMAAVSFVSIDGEEGPLSQAVSAGESIYMPTPIEPTVAKIRVYQTNKDSDVLYEVGEVPVGTASFELITDRSVFGRVAETQFKSRMVGGSYVRYWRGRLLVARGRKLYFSDPLRYGLYDQSGGWVAFPARIDFVEPVEGGVYVALKDMGVHFLAGESPSKWELRVADIVPAQANTSLLVPTAQMKLDMQNIPDWVAVWLTSKGFALGLPSGLVVYPQADLLSGLPLGTGSLHFEGDRLIALSQ